jgi:hypothetical protein
MRFERIHAGYLADAADTRMTGQLLLDAMTLHFARVARFQVGGTDPQGLARIVARARAFILQTWISPCRSRKSRTRLQPRIGRCTARFRPCWMRRRTHMSRSCD